MRKAMKRTAAILLCGGLVAGCIGATAVALKTKEKPEKVTAVIAEKVQEPALFKDETVYVLANADGSVQKIIVSDWIKNTLFENRIEDHTELSDPQNVKGDETYTLNGDNMKVWDAAGNDIYYTGNIKKELPVDLSVTYSLDGKPISPQNLAGKSGRVTVRFDYRNRQYETVEIDGKKEKINVPFVMLTGMLLDSDKFRNISVTNGKLINDGDHTAVIGLALPGLQENLALDQALLTLPDFVEITADVKDFSFGMTVTLATNGIFNLINTEKLRSVEALTDSLGELTDGMKQLTDGSSALYGGLCTLLQKSGTLVKGIDQLADGVKQLRDGAAALDDGVAQASNAAGQLSSGLKQLTANNATLNGGAKQVFEGLLATADAQLSASGVTVPQLTVENYAEVLNGVITSLGDPTGNEAAQKMIALKKSLDDYNAFYLGLLQYTGGVTSAADGAKQLADGMTAVKGGSAELRTGTARLYDGVLQIKNGLPALVDGVTQLKDGAMQLSGGLKQLNEEGIGKIIGIGDTAKRLVTRLRATVDVSENYRNFAGKSDEMGGKVKFIYRTDEIE